VRKGLAVLAGAVASFALASSASAAPQVTGQFNLPSMPRYLTQGPDGNIWVAYGTGDVSRVTPNGAVTTFNPPDIVTIGGITSANGKIWTTGGNEIGSFSPSDPNNTDDTFPVTGVSAEAAIVRGSDGNLWTAGLNNVFKVPPAAPTTATPTAVADLDPRDVDAANGLIWVADASAPGRVIRVTTGGVVTPFNVGGMVQGVAAGPGTDAAYANPGNVPQQVGRIQGGVIKKTNRPNDPFGITLGTDGAYWTALFASNPFSLGRFTTAGAITTLPGLSGGPRQITVGPNNTLWAGLEQVSKIARISGVTPPTGGGGGAGGGNAADTTAPRFVGARLSRKTFRRGRRGPARIAATRIRTGTTVRLNLSEAARLTFRFEVRQIGRRVGGRCRRRTRRNANRRRCVRYVLVRRRSFTINGLAGLNKVRFEGRTSRRRALRANRRYRMVIRAKDSAGNLSVRRRLGFRLLPPARR
jgi:hypothetical protein